MDRDAAVRAAEEFRKAFNELTANVLACRVATTLHLAGADFTDANVEQVLSGLDLARRLSPNSEFRSAVLALVGDISAIAAMMAATPANGKRRSPRRPRPSR